MMNPNIEYVLLSLLCGIMYTIIFLYSLSQAEGLILCGCNPLVILYKNQYLSIDF